MAGDLKASGKVAITGICAAAVPVIYHVKNELVCVVDVHAV